MVTVMVICCPYALGLAVPLVAAISTSLSAKHGPLIRNRTAFGDSRKVTTVVFDKTGTLTTGRFGVSHLESLDGISDQKLLAEAASVEQSSEHPIAEGIEAEAKRQHVATWKPNVFRRRIKRVHSPAKRSFTHSVTAS